MLEPMLPPPPPIDGSTPPEDTSLEALKRPTESDPEPLDTGELPGGSLLPLLLLVGLAAFHLFVNLWWLGADSHPIRTDEEGHMLFARQFHEVLFVQDFPDPVRRLIALSQIRPGIPAHPPLYQWLGAGMVALFGYSPDVIAATSSVLFVVLLLGIYALARGLLPPWHALFATFVVSMTPIVFASSRYFMTDYGSAAVAVWALYSLIRSDGFRHTGWSLGFAVLNGLGILIRTVTFAYFLLPALVVAVAGLVAAFRRDAFGPARSTVLANLMLVLLVSGGLAAPWYYANLEPFYDYWANKEISGTRGPLTNFAPPPAPVETPPATNAAPALPVEQGAYARTFRTLTEKIGNPPVAWIRYPVYLVNDGLFAVLAGLALLGMAAAPFIARYRSLPLLCLYGWIFGSWVFFTVIIRSATPRYALPVAPALALFAALLILALPARWMRRGAAGLLGTVLLFQFALLTFQAPRENARVSLPVALPADEARHFADPNLLLFKDHVSLGFSYAQLGGPERDNFQERLLRAMVKHEQGLPAIAGQYANYQKLNVRGLEFHERHFWPGENPYRLPGLKDEDLPKRRLSMIHMGMEPEHLLPRLSETDYIVYEAPAADPGRAEAYRAYFAARGFTEIESFDVPAFGWVPAVRYGVLARNLDGELVPVTAETIGDMTLYELHDLKYSADFARLDPALQGLVRGTFEENVKAVATPFQLNDAVTFMTADTTRVDASTYRFRLVFQVHTALDRNWRVLFHGYTTPENLTRLPADKQAQGYVDWNFDPLPPATEWVPGDYVVLTHQIVAEPLLWQFKFGLFQGDLLYGRTALLQTMDFAALKD